MATESSAIARLVDAAQNQGMPGTPGRDGVFTPIDQQTDPNASQVGSHPPGKKSGGGAWWLLVVAIVVIGGSVAGGYVLAQQQGEDTASGAGVDELGAASGEESTRPKVDPKALAASTVMPPVPGPVAPSTVPPIVPPTSADAQEAVEEELEPELSDDELALAGKTGFDILVEPKGAKVTLDGHAIGAAPLRVRNLLPGVHQIDIEGPDGYFGQHQEFDLGAGEAMILRLSLDALGPSTAQVEPIADNPEAPKKQTARQRRKARKEANKNSVKKSSNRRQAPSASEEKDLAEAGEVSLGTLMLGAKPPCEIVINGKKTGLTTPQRSIQLPEGTHRVVLINDQHKIRKSFKVRIKSGRTTRAIQDLTKKL